MELLLIDPRYQPLSQELGWTTVADILRLFSATGAISSKKVVITPKVLPRRGEEPLL